MSDSPTSYSQLIWPKANKLWEIIRDFTFIHIFYITLNTNIYIIITHYFCDCLQLIVFRLLVEQLSAIGYTIMLFFFAILSKNDKDVLTKALEVAWDWAKGHIISRIRAYANAWFGTPSDTKYQKDYIKLIYISITIFLHNFFMQNFTKL